MAGPIASSCSLVIRCFNEEKHIGKLLTGVLAQTISDVEIILVDSGSTDATLSIAARYPVHVISVAPEDFSFGRSLNLGCAKARHDLIVIASAHVYPVYTDWIERLLSHFNDPDVAAVYGKQRAGRNARYSERQVYNKWYPDSTVNHQKHPFCNNANAAIRRSIWRQLPYNEDLTGLEDLDWAKRVIALGKKIAYSAEAEIVHNHDETAANVFNRYKREALAFKQIYPNEHFQAWDFARLLFANVITDFYHAKRAGALLENITAVPTFRFLQFWGTFMGYRADVSITRDLRNRFYYPNELLARKAPTASKRDPENRINYEHF